MPKEPNKPRVLFIASNIPTPKRKSNKVVMTIAHKLSDSFDISVLHPAEWTPFPINMFQKYKSIVGNHSWKDDGIVVRPFKYIRLIGTDNAFRLLPYYGPKIINYCQKFGTPQLVHAHYALPDGYLAFLFFKTHKVPYIISFRKSDIKFLQSKKSNSTYKMMQIVLSHASQIIVHNAAQQQYLSDEGFDSIIIPHGLEKDFIAKKEHENHSDIINIATVGELIPLKQIDWVINSVKNYKGNKNITLTIAGDGPMRQELESLTQDHSNIVFLGKVDHSEVGELLSRNDIFALPSNNETFGLVYIEAAAHQNAVIATKGTGVWGVFDDKEELRDQLSKKAYKKTSENFTWEKIIEKYNNIYHKLFIN